MVHKLGKKIKNLFVSRARMKDLRGRFIRTTEPFFSDYIRKSGNDDFMTELQILYFEKRSGRCPVTHCSGYMTNMRGSTGSGLIRSGKNCSIISATPSACHTA